MAFLRIMTMFQAECQRMPVRRKVVARTTFVHSFVIVMQETLVSRVASWNAVPRKYIPSEEKCSRIILRREVLSGPSLRKG